MNKLEDVSNTNILTLILVTSNKFSLYILFLLVDIHPLNQNVAEGRSCQFTCLARTISGEGSISVQWSKEGQQLPFNAIDDGGVLTINSASQADSGRYVCTATYGDHIAKSYAYLSVDRYGPQEFRSAYYGNGVCQSDEKICGNSECVKLEYVCDGEPDCRDHTDEQNCPRYHHCQPNEFKCKNQHCVQKMWLCDGEDDCGDNSDEEHCGQKIQPNGCSPSQFKCLNVNQCIPNSFHCDGTNDCGDGSDEIGCVQPTVVEPPETSKQVEQGGTFKLTCRAVAVPDAYISWRLNWGPVCKPPRCIQSSERGIGVLTVTNVQPADQGAYTCEAINVKGRVLATPDCIVRIVGVATSQSQPPTLPPSTLPPLLCNKAGTDDSSNNYGDKCQCKPLVTGPRCDECRPGAFQLSEDSPQGCLKCFCFGITNDCHSSTYYRIKESLVFRNNPQGIYLSDIDENIEANAQFEYTYKGMLTYSGSHEKTFYWKLPQRFLGNKVSITAYGGKMTFQLRFSCSGRINNEPLVVIKGNGMTLVYRPQNPETTFVTDEAFNITVNTYETNYYHLNGQRSTREELMMTLVDLDAYLIRATHCFGQQVTSLGDVTWEVAVNRITNGGMALEVEMCNCPPGYIGTSCEMCAEGYERSKNGNYLGTCVPARPKIQCFADGSLDAQPIYGDVCTCKAYVTGATCNECIPGSFYLSHKNPDGCIRCFCSGVTKQCSSSSLYRTAVEINYLRGAHEILDVTLLPRHEGVRLTLHGNELGSQILYWNLPEKFLGNKVTSYGGVLKYKFLYTGSQHLTPDDDVIIKGSDITLHHKTSQRIHPNTENVIEVPFYENEWGRPDGGLATRESLMMVLSDLSSILIKLTYSSDSTSSSLVFVSMEYAQSEYNGNEMALVEECQCPEGYIGTSCEECADGWYRGSSLYLGICTRCQCNGHSSHCDKKTGVCIDCRDNTAGDHCEYCKPGFERDVSNIASAGCLPKTTPCNCNNHSPQGCDFASRCWRCEHNTEGQFCERCKKGFYGDATKGTAFDCLPCPCPGSSECYEVDGQPHCKNCPPGFTGPRCETCAPGYTPGTSPGSRTCQPIGEHVNSSVVFVPKIEGEVRSGLSRQRRRRYRYCIDVKLVIDPEKATVTEGKSVSFHCRVQGDKCSKIEWYKGQELDMLPDGMAAGTNGVLKTQSAKLYHSGIYTCVATLKSGRKLSKIAMLNVKQSIPDPKVEPSILSVSDGEKAEFRCFVPGHPEYKITWENENGVRMKTENEILRFPYATISDSGRYVCNAIRPDGSQPSTRPVVTLNVVIRKLPQPIVKPRYIRINKHESAKFECVVPPGWSVEYAWKSKESNEVVAKGKTLQFADSNFDDAGKYTCVVRRPESGETRESDPGTLEVVEERPVRPVVQPLVQNVNENGTASLRCFVPNKPGAFVQWHKLNGQLPKGINPRDPTLFLAHASDEDSGEYICSTADHYGNPLDSDPARINIIKSFFLPVVNPKTQTVKEGDDCEIVCSVPNNADVELKWERNDGNQFTDRVIDDGSGKLMISNTRFKDVGEYVCIAKDPVTGQKTKETATVEISLVPVVVPAKQSVDVGQPSEFTCVVHGDAKGQIKWYFDNPDGMPDDVIIDENKLMIPHSQLKHMGDFYCQIGKSRSNPGILIVKGSPPQPFASPSKQNVKIGNSASFNCDARSALPTTVEWEHNGEIVHEDDLHKIDGNTLTVNAVDNSDSGSYVCLATNDFGRSASNEVFLTVFLDDYPPTVEVDPPFWEGHYGDSHRFKCIATGEPTPNVVWEGPHGELPENVTVVNGSELEFSYGTLKHNGVYTCRATNSIGSAEDTGFVNIEPIISIRTNPPEINPRIPAGSPLSITCDALGDPKPTVMWIHDEERERGDLPDDYKAIHIDEKVITHPHLNIGNSGEYICQANSSFGIVSKKINITVVGLMSSSTVAILGGNNQRFHLGSREKLICITTAPDLIDKLEWIKDGSPVDSNSTKDSGTYVCQAYLNGEMFASTKVNVYSMNSALPTTHFVTVDGDYVKIAVQGEWLPMRCITCLQVENGRLSFDAVREDNRGLYECSAVLDKDSPPISMTKYLHVENAKRKRKHISEKLYNKIHKAEKKQRPLFSEWESSL
uniref:Basement membrane proteoglycan n=1 Tax=Syphacia muris TaxID=451379 RepID=A0A158R3R0_9BILA